MMRSLPPVRSAAPLRRWPVERARALFTTEFAGYDVRLCRSGTDALAAAIQLACRRKAIANPEVILPAYGCADLVAACLGAGARPRLVDLAEGAWRYDNEALHAALGDKTVALLAVNLLGLGDDAHRLSAVARAADVLLIQDCAQHVPLEAGWRADVIVLSFGRGKPVNVLGGGALLTCSVNPREIAPIFSAETPKARFRQSLLGSVPVSFIFNAMSHPRGYGVVTRLPGLALGETRYSPLDRIVARDDSAWSRIGPAFEDYLVPSPALEFWRGALPSLAAAGVHMPAPSIEGMSPRRMLRLPLLAPEAGLRDRIVNGLQSRGLGGSAMYAVALNQLNGIPQLVTEQGPFPMASRLAARLFTVPTHKCVTEADVRRAVSCIVSLCRAGA
jgi:dTDP-4-amino-4,6-dideoxygalactose transaminase